MPTPLQDKLLSAAQLNAGLIALIGGAPFRWYFDQLQQGSTIPAVVSQIISEVPVYSFTAQGQLVKKRVQLTLWGDKYDGGRQAADNIAAAIKAFMATFDATGVGLDQGVVVTKNTLALQREWPFLETDPIIFRLTQDWMIFDNELI